MMLVVANVLLHKSQYFKKTCTTDCEVVIRFFRLYFPNHVNMYNCVIRKKKLEAKVKKLEGNWHPVTPLVGAITLVRAIGVCAGLQFSVRRSTPGCDGVSLGEHVKGTLRQSVSTTLLSVPEQTCRSLSCSLRAQLTSSV